MKKFKYNLNFEKHIELFIINLSHLLFIINFFITMYIRHDIFAHIYYTRNAVIFLFESNLNLHIFYIKYEYLVEHLVN